MHIGIIGTGSMGGMLTTAFCEAGHESVFIYNRTASKAQLLKDTFSDVITLCENPIEVVSQSDLIFLCTKFTDLPPIFESIRSTLQDNQYVISINSHITLRDLEESLSCKVAKVIPSITQTARSGILLFMGGRRLNPHDEDTLFAILRTIGIPYAIEEDMTRVYSDLTSCGPAFMANLLLQYVQAAKQHGVEEDVAEHLIASMMIGLGKLITEKNMTLQDVVTRVSVPGGVTEAGLRVLQDADQDVLLRVLSATAQKQEEMAHKTT